MASPDSHQYLVSDMSLGYQLIEPISIDDDDIMWGGKSLSAWYEEERERVSGCSEEERRGRQRVSSPIPPFFFS